MKWKPKSATAGDGNAAGPAEMSGSAGHSPQPKKRSETESSAKWRPKSSEDKDWQEKMRGYEKKWALRPQTFRLMESLPEEVREAVAAEFARLSETSVRSPDAKLYAFARRKALELAPPGLDASLLEEPVEEKEEEEAPEAADNQPAKKGEKAIKAASQVDPTRKGARGPKWQPVQASKAAEQPAEAAIAKEVPHEVERQPAHASAATDRPAQVEPVKQGGQGLKWQPVQATGAAAKRPAEARKPSKASSTEGVEPDEKVVKHAKLWNLDDEAVIRLCQLPRPLREAVLSNFQPAEDTKNINARLGAFIRAQERKAAGQEGQSSKADVEKSAAPPSGKKWAAKGGAEAAGGAPTGQQGTDVKGFAHRWGLEDSMVSRLWELDETSRNEVMNDFHPPEGTRNPSGRLAAFIAMKQRQARTVAGTQTKGSPPAAAPAAAKGAPAKWQPGPSGAGGASGGGPIWYQMTPRAERSTASASMLRRSSDGSDATGSARGAAPGGPFGVGTASKQFAKGGGTWSKALASSWAPPRLTNGKSGGSRPGAPNAGKGGPRPGRRPVAVETLGLDDAAASYSIATPKHKLGWKPSLRHMAGAAAA